ncbi:MAG: hypothetical protein ACYC7F_07205 [Gemmatimonadaceae bacterium]
MLPNARVLTAFVSMLTPVMLVAQAPADSSKLNAADHATMDHAAHQALMKACTTPAVLPSLPGQAAFGAIAEVVGILRRQTGHG